MDGGEEEQPAAPWRGQCSKAPEAVNGRGIHHGPPRPGMHRDRPIQVTPCHIADPEMLVIICQNFSGCALFPILPPFSPSDLVSRDDDDSQAPDLRISREQWVHAMCRSWLTAPTMRTCGRLLHYGSPRRRPVVVTAVQGALHSPPPETCLTSPEIEPAAMGSRGRR